MLSFGSTVYSFSAMLAVFLFGLAVGIVGAGIAGLVTARVLTDLGHQVTVYFPLQPRPYLPRPQDIADTVRQQLKAVGLDARIQGEDKNKLFPGVATGQYELILIGWMTDNRSRGD